MSDKLNLPQSGWILLGTIPYHPKRNLILIDDPDAALVQFLSQRHMRKTGQSGAVAGGVCFDPVEPGDDEADRLLNPDEDNQEDCIQTPPRHKITPAERALREACEAYRYQNSERGSGPEDFDGFAEDEDDIDSYWGFPD